MLNIIVTGGLGAGKTNLVNNIAKTGNWIIGSPATTMKRMLAQVIARTWNGGGNDNDWHMYYEEMMGRTSKEKYRGLLQGYGEFFSNQDNFFWIRKVMNEVQQDVAGYAYGYNELPLAGTLYDSIRRPSEIIGIREVYPNAILVNLHISLGRQTKFLRDVLGYDITKAHETLIHASEHWLDNPDKAILIPDIVIEADAGDDYILSQFWKGVKRLGAN